MSTQQVIRTLQLDKLSLYAVVDTETKRHARLTWAIRNGYPRLIVYTNHLEYGASNLRDAIIAAPMDIVTFNAFLDIFSKVIDGEKDKKYKIDCFNYVWKNNQRTDEKRLVSSVIVGKDKEGVIWLSVITEDKPKIKFSIILSDFHMFYKTHGDDLKKDEASHIAAKAYLRIVKSVFDKLIGDDIIDTGKVYENTPPPPKTKTLPQTKVAETSSELEEFVM